MAATDAITPGKAFIDNFTQANQNAKTQTDGLQDRFLKLLITQMQNQDPLNPLDNAQVTSQLAQISTVSGIDKLNNTITNMVTQLSAAQSMQAGSLIGRGVLAEGNNIELSQGLAAGGVQLSEPADAISVSIRDNNGVAIKTLNLGARDSGTQSFTWDGSTDAGTMAADGRYTFEVTAVRNGKKVEAEELGYGYVQSVTVGGDQLQLNTIGLGQVPMGLIKQIL